MSTEIENPETPVEATTTPAAPEETTEAIADEGQKPQRKRRDGDVEVTDEQLMEMYDFSKPIPRVSRYFLLDYICELVRCSRRFHKFPSNIFQKSWQSNLKYF